MEFTLFGIALGVIVLSAVKAVQGEFGISDKDANRLRAVLMVGAYLLYTFAPDIQAAWPEFKRVVVVGGGAVTVFLSVLGYWPEVQKVGARIKGD